MPRRNLTSLFVETAKLPARGQITYWDIKLSGFGLRLSQGGAKSWTVAYRHQGRMRWLKLGTYPTLKLADARDMARSRLAEVQKGLDPASLKSAERDADTFRTLTERYVDEHARVKKKRRSALEDEKNINRELLPVWGSRKASSIKRRDVIALVDGIGRRAPIQANRILALISKIFNFAIAKEVVEVNPATRVVKPSSERTRERFLNDDEIKKVWQAFEREGLQNASLFKLLLLTGQRRDEVMGMRWDELNLDTGEWLLSGERTKNKRPHLVPIVRQTHALLTALNENRRDPVFVFPGRRKGQPITNPQKPLNRIKQQSGVDFRIHDLRRTCATNLGRLKVPRLVVAKILNHVDRDVTGLHYDRYEYGDEKKIALSKWADCLKPTTEI
jgi:integrase